MYCTGSKDGTGAWDRSQSWAYFPVDNLRLPLVAPVSVAAAAVVSSVPSLALWYARLGHASSSQVQQLASRGLLGSVSIENFNCVFRKQPTLPFNTNESISTDIFDLIHFDVWGPSSVSSIGGSQYFVVFVDDYSCYSWNFNMKYRSELLQVYYNFAKMVET